MGRVWGPTQDLGFEEVYHNAFLPELPHSLRSQNKFEKIPILMGINRNEGVEFASIYHYQQKTIYSTHISNVATYISFHGVSMRRFFSSLEMMDLGILRKF